MAANFLVISDMDAVAFRELWDRSKVVLKPAVERLLKEKKQSGG